MGAAGLRADVEARPVALAAVFDAGQQAADGWWPGFRASFGPQVRATDYRGPEAWPRALASRPAIALLATRGIDYAPLRIWIGEARRAGIVPVIVLTEPSREAARTLAAELKVPLIEPGRGVPQRAGLEAARALARAVAQLQPFVRDTQGKTIEVVVAQDGSGDFKTVQYAIDHAPVPGPDQRLIVHIRPGVYRERVVVPRDRARVTLLGEDAQTTVITYRMGGVDSGGTFLSATVRVTADDFQAENLTIENTFGVGSQAVALHLESDRAVVRHCRLLGWQDTLYATSGRQYYRDCYIEGHVDFLFGNAAAYFEQCEIHSLGRGYLTAHSRTQVDGATGFVFDHCRLTAKDPAQTVYLGRPWRPYARVLFLHCWMDRHIAPAGWDPWGSPMNEYTAVFGEFDSTGPGAQMQQRVPWARTVTAAEAAAFAADRFLAGADHWAPGSGLR